MSKSTVASDLPIHPFASRHDFEAFLDREHLTCPGIWLKKAKKSAGAPSISHAEAIEVALCFGWIDSQGKAFDEHWSLTRFTPRRPKSLWSKKNVETIARLTAAGEMRPAGFAAVEAAKADGRWERAYAGPATIEVPDDFAAVLAENAAAALVFEGLNRTHRYAVLWRVHTASLQNRAKRIDSLVTGLAQGKVPGRPELGTKPKRKADEDESSFMKAGPASQKATKQRRAVSAPEGTPRRSGLRPRS